MPRLNLDGSRRCRWMCYSLYPRSPLSRLCFRMRATVSARPRRKSLLLLNRSVAGINVALNDNLPPRIFFDEYPGALPDLLAVGSAHISAAGPEEHLG